MDTSDITKNDAKENNSVLLKLWQRATQKKAGVDTSDDEVPTPSRSAVPPPAAVVVPEQLPPTPFRAKGINEEDYIHMLWSSWAKSVTNAPKFKPADCWDKLVESGAVQEDVRTLRDHTQFYDQIFQAARADYESIRSVIAANQMARQAATEEKLAAEQRMQKAIRDVESAGGKADSISSAELDAATEYEKSLKDAPMPAINAKIFVKISTDKMLVLVFVLPAQNGGEGITAEDIESNINRAGVKFGVDESITQQVLAGEGYFKLLLLARGVMPVHGIDGRVTDMISAGWTVQPRQSEEGLVDYKNIGTIHNILKGTVLCNIVLPVEPIDGMSVDGNVAPGIVGKSPKLPQGTYTEVSPQGTELIASEDGHVVIEGDKFVIKTSLTFNGDVDIAIGNLNFPGSITVMGDVREGFEVSAHGNISIKGMVEGAKIVSGGDIVLERGMNGNGTGVLEAQGNIQTKFLENCIVYAKGSITAGSIICSDVSCDDVLTVRSGKGVIIGGKCVVRKSIDAKAIGNESNRITVVSVGNSSGLIDKKKTLEKSIKQLADELDEIKKTMVYIISNISEMSAARRAKIKQLRERAPIIEVQAKEMTEQLNEVNQIMLDVMDSRIKCDTIFPPVKITIGLASCNVEEVHTKCNIYYSEGEVIFGNW